MALIRFAAVWVMVAVFCLVASAQVASPVNPGFEDAGGGDGVPGWTWDAEAGGVEVVGGAIEGDRCVHLTHDGEGTWQLISEPIAVEPETLYVASAWIRLAEGSERASLRVIFLRGDEEILSYIPDMARSYPGDWQRVVNILRTPERCDRARVVLIGGKHCEGWIDQVDLRPWRRPAGTRVNGWMTRRPKEAFARSVLGVPAGKGLHVSWRLLKSDPETIAFDLYRRSDGGRAEKINDEPITQTTDFMDADVTSGFDYSYAVVAAKTRPDAQTRWSVETRPSIEKQGYYSIPLRGPHTFQKVAIGDLDGDGLHDFVIKQPDSNVDPYSAPGYWHRSPGTYTLEAYRHDGRFLWELDLGWSIEQGAWYSPYLVYDLDGDGRCEVIVKTGKGDPRTSEGKVLDGPEYLTILEGATGKILSQSDYEPLRGEIRGPNAYNRYDSRNLMTVAYLDGKTPCLIVERGTYHLTIVKAFQFRSGRLESLWTWRGDQWPGEYWGQGSHSIRVADVDADGRDEVLIGSFMLDDDGLPLWTTGLGHPDHCYLGDLDPERPGLEIYFGIERAQPRDGMGMVDARTGERLWGWDKPTKHVHSSGLVADLDPSLPGVECYSKDKARTPEGEAWWFDAKGNLIGRRDMRFGFRAAWWDADPQREMFLSNGIQKYKGDVIGPAVEGKIIAVTDVVGDWREEVITTLPGEMRIYSTPIPAVDRRPCLMQDAIYRMDVLNQSMGYVQVPTPSFDMASQATR